MKLLAATPHFELIATPTSFRLVYTRSDAEPRTERLSMSDVDYLMNLPRAGDPSPFDRACVVEFGLAIFRKT